MKLARFRHPNGSIRVGLIEHFTVTPLDMAGDQYNTLADILEADDPDAVCEFLADVPAALSLGKVKLLAPIERQEVWAAGVTYRRSQTARMEESEAAASCYDRVYQSERPELFFKANPHRVVGPGQGVRIRTDSQWTVPEPELALVLSSRLRLVGFTIGNDMSARDIEGENPLYLPQAKVYDGCCSLGPCVSLVPSMPPAAEIRIELRILRAGKPVFADHTSIAEMARSFDDLISWLGRETSFPYGAILLTGTGIVPDSDFALRHADIIEITVTGVGTLVNPVVGPEEREE